MEGAEGRLDGGLTLDGGAACEGCVQASDWIGHGRTPCSDCAFGIDDDDKHACQPPPAGVDDRSWRFDVASSRQRTSWQQCGLTKRSTALNPHLLSRARHSSRSQTSRQNSPLKPTASIIAWPASALRPRHSEARRSAYQSCASAHICARSTVAPRGWPVRSSQAWTSPSDRKAR